MSGGKDEYLVSLNDWLSENFPELSDDELDDAAHKLGDYLWSILGDGS